MICTLDRMTLQSSSFALSDFDLNMDHYSLFYTAHIPEIIIFVRRLN